MTLWTLLNLLGVIAFVTWRNLGFWGNVDGILVYFSLWCGGVFIWALVTNQLELKFTWKPKKVEEKSDDSR